MNTASRLATLIAASLAFTAVHAQQPGSPMGHAALTGSITAALAAGAAPVAAKAALSAADAAKLGAPAYPGSKLDDDYGPNAFVSKPGHMEVRLITDDSFAKVVAFYKQHLPANAAKPPIGDPTMDAVFEIGQADGDDIRVSILAGSPADPQLGTPASGTQIDISHDTAK